MVVGPKGVNGVGLIILLLRREWGCGPVAIGHAGCLPGDTGPSDIR